MLLSTVGDRFRMFDFSKIRLPELDINKKNKQLSFRCQADGSLQICFRKDDGDAWMCRRLPKYVLQDLGRFLREVYGD